MGDTLVINIMKYVNNPEMFQKAMRDAAIATRDGKRVVPNHKQLSRLT